VTGTLISGSTALQFFDRTVYEDSDLDLFVEHASARPLTLWLESIGYKFIPNKDADYKTLEMAFDKKTETNTDDSFFEPFVDKCGFHPIVSLEFHRENYPNIQVITSKGPPLEMVLDFHSSELVQFI